MGYIGQTPTAVPLDADDLADDIISLAKMASGTDGNIITYDASGNPAAVATGSSGQVLTSAGAGAAPTFAAGGKVIQIVNVLSGTVATGTTTMPYDDTIPQNSEGTEFLTLAITPTSSSNKLLIEVDAMFGCGTAEVNVSAGLFQDSTASALAAKGDGPSFANSPHHLSIKHYMAAGTTSATTFKLRIGGASSSTITFNGTGGVRRLGACTLSSITITEIAV